MSYNRESIGDYEQINYLAKRIQEIPYWDELELEKILSALNPELFRQ